MQAGAAPLEDAPNLRQRGLVIPHVLEHLIRIDEVEGFVFERNTVPIADLDEAKERAVVLEQHVHAERVIAHLPERLDLCARAASEVQNLGLWSQRVTELLDNGALNLEVPEAVLVVLHLCLSKRLTSGSSRRRQRR